MGVLRHAVKPLLAGSSRHVESITGEDVELTCVVLAGNPTPRVTWTRLMPRGEPHLRQTTIDSDRLTDDGRGSSLKLKDVTVDDEGDYQCTASNVGGTASTTFTLDVLGNYSIPRWHSYCYHSVCSGITCR